MWICLFVAFIDVELNEMLVLIEKPLDSVRNIHASIVGILQNVLHDIGLVISVGC